MTEDVVGGRMSRHHRHPAAGRGETAQDVALGAVIDGDDMEFRVFKFAEAIGKRPFRLVPGIGLAAGDVTGQVHAFQPRPRLGLGPERVDVDGAVFARRMDDDPRRRA